MATPPDFGHIFLRKSSETPIFIVFLQKMAKIRVSKIAYTDFWPFFIFQKKGSILQSQAFFK